jgi:hypothetical protein
MLGFNVQEIIRLEDLLGVARILFGFMVFVKMYYSFKARTLVWSHRYPFGSPKAVTVLLGLQLFLSVLFSLGIYTFPVSVLLWMNYLFLFKYASLFGLEDVVFHMFSFYWVFGAAKSSFQLGTSVGLAHIPSIFGESFLPEYFLAIMAGLIFLSAGITKLPSRMWSSGVGAYIFFSLPNFRRLDTSKLVKRESMSRFLNFSALVMEVGVLPTFLLNPVPVGIFFWIMAFVFTTCLFTIFILTWIGEALSTAMLIVLWLLLYSDTNPLIFGLVEEAQSLSTIQYIFFVGLSVIMVAGLWTALQPDTSGLKSPLLKKLYLFSRYVCRFTWGFIPCDVFTESHMKGSIVYRVFASYEGKGPSEEIFKIYSEDCSPGPDRNFKPTFYEVTSYKVVEACMELEKFGGIKTSDREEFIKNLSTYILRYYTKRGTQVTNLDYQIIQLNPPGTFKGNDFSWYRDEKWESAFQVLFSNGKYQGIQRNEKMAPLRPTGRSLERNSFSFISEAH